MGFFWHCVEPAELCVGDLAVALGASDHTAGYALRMLTTAGMASFRKESSVVYYRQADRFPMPLLDHCLPALASPGAGAGPR